MFRRIFRSLTISLAVVYLPVAATAQADTLRIMGYNVLYYGSGCQGANGLYHNYLKTIVGFANPDVISLEKLASIPVSADDKYGTAPAGFADSILQYALNAAYPGRYAYCPFSNNAHTNNMAVLFYDQRKLGFVSVVSSYVNITDFNTYKLYYKDPNLARTHDTTFLYILPTHDRSGDDNGQVRGMQIAEEMRHIKEHFTRLPNFINMGDFNVRSSNEPFYQTLTNGDDASFRFFDPPFYPDKKLAYPAVWDHNGDFSAYFTTSTRVSESIPNSCGTGGGAKNWYDHIFLSQWIVENTDHIMYIPNSYRTIGNDGHRYRRSINDNGIHSNTSAPRDVIEALYQMSNKYPVMADLLVTQNASGASPHNPEIAGVNVLEEKAASVDNPVGDMLVFHFPADMKGQEVSVVCTDKDKKIVFNRTVTIRDTKLQLGCDLPAGAYSLKVTGHHNTILETGISKQ